VTYRAELSGRALKQMHGLPAPACDSLIEAMAEVIDYPDEALRTFPTGDPYPRRAEFGDAGLITYLMHDAASKVLVLHITSAGQQFLHVLDDLLGVSWGRLISGGRRHRPCVLRLRAV
jgi:hypothetical protein